MQNQLKNKGFTALCIAVFMSQVVFGQSVDEPYTQPVNGTKLSFDLVPIPGGEFTMGSEGKQEDESPAHRVKVDSFWMGKYEVTWELFEAFAYKDYEKSISENKQVPENIDAITRPTKPYLDMTFGMGKGKHPAVAMTQYSAIQFCKWIYERTGVFYRLPTEAEWEYACRAGEQGDYFFGDDPALLPEYAWFVENSEDKTAEVGQKKPNAFGLYDMIGNVAEWTYDQYIEDAYKGRDGVVENPLQEATELYPHVVRGGSYQSEAEDLRSAKRDYSDPSWKQIDPQIPKSNWWFPEAPFVGFRVVRPVNPPSKEEIEAYYNQEPIMDF